MGKTPENSYFDDWAEERKIGDKKLEESMDILAEMNSELAMAKEDIEACVKFVKGGVK